MKDFPKFILKHSGRIFWLGLILAAIGAYYSVFLYKNLRTDLEELLPTTARSVLDMNDVSRRLESTDNLAVVIFSQDTKGSKRFVEDLAARLSQFPKNIVAAVEYRIGEELKFFEERRALYMELSDLEKIREYIDYQRETKNPLKLFDDDDDIKKPSLDFKELRAKYSQKTSSYSRFPEGYYATPDEKIRVLLVDLPGSSSGVGGAQRLREAVDTALKDVVPAKYAADIEVKFSGGVQNLLDEHHSLLADLGLSTTVVIILVSAAMIFFYRSFRASMALLLSLLMGTCWTFGLSYFLVGYLNANTAFLGSIVIGNGINFGIILLARYFEDRRNGLPHAAAIESSIQNTYHATLTAALAAGLAYGSLMLTDFRGFRQFGIIGLAGMVLCWISAYTLLPAVLTLMEKRKALAGEIKKDPPKAFLFGPLAKLIQHYPKQLCIVSAVITLLSIASYTRFNDKILETDMSKLRDKKSLESGSGYNSKYVDQVFQRYLAPIVIMAHSREEATKISALLAQRKGTEGKESLISAVYSLDDFHPPEQEAKIKKIAEIQKLLSPAILKRLSSDEQKMVSGFMTPEVQRPFSASELPPLVKKKFTEKTGAMGNLVLVEPPLTSITWAGDRVVPFIHELREVADSVSPGIPVAGQIPVTADMIEAIKKDGPSATACAFVAVILLVVILFRNLRMIVLTLFALILGFIWMSGAVLATGLKINFLNFIALPITFGIGVDYGVNIFQRYLIEGPGSILKVIRQTGGAVGLASLTTIIGYGSLLLAGNQALLSFGKLAVLGEITCLTAAVVCLPAVLAMFQRPGQR